MRFRPALLIALVSVFALSACAPPASDIQSARDMKELLDQRGIECADFLVESSEALQADILSCKDGSGNEENSYSFSIWSSANGLAIGLQDLCKNLDRRRMLDDQVVLGQTWMALTDSAFVNAEELSDELEAQSFRATDLCNEREFPIDVALSKEAAATCLEVEEAFRTIPALKFNIPTENPWGDITALGLYENGRTMQTKINSIVTAINMLKRHENLPEEFFPLIQAFEQAQEADPLDRFIYPARLTSHYGLASDPFTWRDILLTELVNGWEIPTHDQEFLDVQLLASEFNNGLVLWSVPLANIVDTCDALGAFTGVEP